VQIGGGVRVGDAFQAIVGFNLMAIWGMWFCVEIFSGEARASRSLQTREIRTEHRSRAEKRSTRAGGKNGL